MIFWAREALIVKIFLLGLLVVVAIALVRLARLVRDLYRSSGEAASPYQIVNGEVDPRILATFALSTGPPGEVTRELRTKVGVSTNSDAVGAVLYSLQTAEDRFLYLCEKSYAEVRAIRRASSLTLLLSLLMVACGAIPTYFWNCNNSNLLRDLCLFNAIDQILRTLAIGLSFCALLYLAAGLLEKTLMIRKASWKYFFATARSELSRS